MGKREKKKPSTQTDLSPGPFTLGSFARPLEPPTLQIKIQLPRNRTLITSCHRSKSGQTENVSDGLNFDRKSKTDETKKASTAAADGTSERRRNNLHKTNEVPFGAKRTLTGGQPWLPELLVLPRGCPSSRLLWFNHLES